MIRVLWLRVRVVRVIVYWVRDCLRVVSLGIGLMCRRLMWLLFKQFSGLVPSRDL